MPACMSEIMSRYEQIGWEKSNHKQEIDGSGDNYRQFLC